jgi:hypothetical protein
VVKRLDFLIKLVKSSDVVVDCFLWLVFQRNQLLEGVALTQHRDVSKIGFESGPNIVSRFTVPDQLEFGFDNGGNKDSHGVTVGYFPCDESLWFVIVIRWVNCAGDNVVQMLPEFNLAFEAPLFVSGSRKRIDRAYDGVQRGIGRHGESNACEFSRVKISPFITCASGIGSERSGSVKER